MQQKILLYGQFGRSWWDDEGITAKDFLRQLDSANADKDVDSILVCINSPGGSISEGIAIYNHIRNQNNDPDAKPIDTRNDGIAYSMGAICLMAGRNVQAFSNTTTMLHTCSGFAWGNVKDLESQAAYMKKVDEGLANSIAAKTGKDLKVVQQEIMNYEDHFYTAQEALDDKLIDEVLEDRSEEADEFQGLSYQEAVAKFATIHSKSNKGEENFFTRLTAFISNQTKPGQEPKGQLSTANNKEDEPMKIGNNLTALLAVFGLKPLEDAQEQDHTPTNEQLEALNSKLEKISTLEDNATNHQQALDDKDKEIQTLKAQVTKLEGQSGANPKAGAEGDVTGDGGEGESFLSPADAKLKAMREEMGYETKTED